MSKSEDEDQEKNLLICVGTARTPFPAIKNFTHELSTLGIIAEVNPVGSAMTRPRSGGTAFVITVASVPGKYAFLTPATSSHQPNDTTRTHALASKRKISTKSHFHFTTSNATMQTNKVKMRPGVGNSSLQLGKGRNTKQRKCQSLEI